VLPLRDFANTVSFLLERNGQFPTVKLFAFGQVFNGLTADAKMLHDAVNLKIKINAYFVARTHGVEQLVHDALRFDYCSRDRLARDQACIAAQSTPWRVFSGGEHAILLSRRDGIDLISTMKRSSLLPTVYRAERMQLQRSHGGVPNFFYKYMAVDEKYLRTVLINSAFYLSSRTQFNDPFDVTCRFAYTQNAKAINQAIRDTIKAGNVPFKRREEVARNVRDRYSSIENLKAAFNAVADRVGIVSLTSSPRNLLMWSHYAMNHTGVCFQFYPSAEAELFNGISAVQYSDTKLVLDIGLPYDEHDIARIFLQKSTEWTYEREWRFVSSRRARQLGPISGNALSGVIYGARCLPQSIEIVQSLLAERVKLGLPRVAEFRAVLSPAHYSVGIFQAARKAAPKNWVGRPST
jgi:hypothetical protein